MVADEQLALQPSFKKADLTTDGGRSYRERPCSRRQALMAADCLEVTERAERRKTVPHVGVRLLRWHRGARSMASTRPLSAYRQPVARRLHSCPPPRADTSGGCITAGKRGPPGDLVGQDVRCNRLSRYTGHG